MVKRNRGNTKIGILSLILKVISWVDVVLVDLKKRRKRKNDQGIYSLVLKLEKNSKINIGKLSSFLFPKGYYVYVGSAMNGLEARITRHKRKDKKFHWHIDYFLKRAKIMSVHITKTSQKLECKLSRKVQDIINSSVILKGFGSSDCKCSSHLFYFKDHDPTEDLKKITLR